MRRIEQVERFPIELDSKAALQGCLSHFRIAIVAVAKHEPEQRSGARKILDLFIAWKVWSAG